MTTAVLVNLGIGILLTIVQYGMFSNNFFLSLIGVPILLMWGFMGRGVRQNAPDRVRLYEIFTCGLGAAFFYIPMIATLLGIKLWPG
jgi:hypothetical protein